MTINQPSYPITTSGLVSHVGAYTDTAAVPVAIVDAKGDLIVATANNTVTRLPAGTTGYVLVADAGAATGVRWVDAASLGGTNPALPANTVLPAITTDGTPAEGETITSTTGTWSNAPTSYTRRWLRRSSVDDATLRAAVYANAESQLVRTDTLLNPPAYPHITSGASGWVTGTATHWAAGFYVGLLWAMYARTGNTTWRTRAETWQAGMDASKTTDTHDLGMMFEYSTVRGFELTGTTALRDSAFTAAATLSARWNATVGAIRSFDAGIWSTWNTIIDSAMNMRLLFWAAAAGAPSAATLYSRALSHMQKLQEHVRTTGGSWHVVEWNTSTGAVISKQTRQGLSNDSTWARGHAWGMTGFVRAYEDTLAANPSEAASFLATAKSMANYYLDNLPSDGVPFWDFDATADKDSSAAAIGAYGLLLLAKYDATRDWRGEAKRILTVLADGYQSTSADGYSLLLHGVSAFPFDVGIDEGLIYTDLFWIKAMDLIADTPANGDAIPSQTASSFQLTRRDAGGTLRVEVTATNAAGSAIAVSNQTPTVAATPALPVNTALPVISTDGTPATGETVSVSNGTWANSPTSYAYQWLRGATNIGANQSTYTLAVGDEGQQVTCRVTASNATGSASATSAAISPTDGGGGGGGTLFWSGSATLPRSEWNGEHMMTASRASVATIGPAGDTRTAWRMEVRDGDSVNGTGLYGERTEFGQDGDDARCFRSDEQTGRASPTGEYYWGFAVYMPPTFPRNLPWNVFTQWKDIPDQGSGSPCCGTYMNSSYFGINAQEVVSANGGWLHQIANSSAILDKWHNFVVYWRARHEAAATKTDMTRGWVTIWYSTGRSALTQVYDNGMITWRGSSTITPRMGLYQEPSGTYGTRWDAHHCHRVGDSFDIVNPLNYS